MLWLFLVDELVRSLLDEGAIDSYLNQELLSTFFLLKKIEDLFMLAFSQGTVQKGCIKETKFFIREAFPIDNKRAGTFFLFYKKMFSFI